MGDILFLAHRVPYPPDRGDKIRSFNILQKLLQLGTVHVATFADDDEDLAHGETLRPQLGSLHIEKRTISKGAGAARALLTGKPISLTIFDSGGIRSFVEETLATRDIDAIFVFSGQMAQFVPGRSTNRFVMDFVDMDSAKFAQYAEESSFPMNLIHAREARRLFDFELDTAMRADASLFVSNAEADLFAKRTGAANVQVLENGIDFHFFDPHATFPKAETESDGPLLVFTGQMDYRPNIEAVRSFARDVFPQVREAHPNVRFAIVGRNPTTDVCSLADRDGVIVTGGVPDIRSWLAAADIVVAPLRMARGIQNKVLEAMAMAKPVVASQPAFEGIDATPGKHLLVARNVVEEVGLIADLIETPERREALGRSARARMIERYSWDATLRPLADLLAIDRELLAEAAE